MIGWVMASLRLNVAWNSRCVIPAFCENRVAPIEDTPMPLLAECHHCRSTLDTAGKAPGDALMCGCGAMVFVVDPDAIEEQAGSPHHNLQAESPRHTGSILICPRCGGTLAERQSKSMNAHDCPACQGLWLS